MTKQTPEPNAIDDSWLKDDSWKGVIAYDPHREEPIPPFDPFGDDVRWESVIGILRCSKKIKDETFAYDMTPLDCDNAFIGIRRLLNRGEELPESVIRFLQNYPIAFSGGNHAVVALELLKSLKEKESEGKPKSKETLKFPPIKSWRNLKVQYINADCITMQVGPIHLHVTPLICGWKKTRTREERYTLEWIYLLSCILGQKKMHGTLKNEDTQKTVRCNVNKWFKQNFRLKDNPILADNSVKFKVITAKSNNLHTGQRSNNSYNGENSGYTREEELTWAAHPTGESWQKPSEEGDNEIDSDGEEAGK